MIVILNQEHNKNEICKICNALWEKSLSIEIDDLKIEILEFNRMELNENNVLDFQNHTFYSFVIIKTGSCIISFGDSLFKLNTGEFIIISPQVQYGLLPQDSSFSIVYCMKFGINLIGERLSEGRKMFKTLTESNFKTHTDILDILEICNTILYESSSKRLAFYSETKNLFIRMMVSIARAINGGIKADYSVPVKSSKNSNVFQKIKSFIEENISKPLSTKDIAKSTFRSEKQVNRIIYEHTGKLSKDYIKEIKLQKAKELINENKLSIKEIIEVLGFSSESYFRRLFKIKTGVTPGEYKKMDDKF